MVETNILRDVAADIKNLTTEQSTGGSPKNVL